MLAAGLVNTAVLLILGKCLLPGTIRFLTDHGRLECNYSGTKLPSSLGIFIWLLLGIQSLLQEILKPWRISTSPEFGELDAKSLVFLAAVTSIFILGWLDDTIGSKSIKGLQGHYRLWREKGVISMGLIKAVGTGSISFWLLLRLHAGEKPPWLNVLDLLLIVLMTNGMNLLDVRPGRALKSFLPLSFFPLFYCSLAEAISLVLPILTGAVLLFPYDLKGKLMIGDAGANLLGFSLGVWLVLWTPEWIKLTALFGAFVLHWLAETSSISRLIDRNRLLGWYDRWGRA